MNIQIGITERGDGGLDTSWYKACLDGSIHGIVVITKNLTPMCFDKVRHLARVGFPVILHATVTGWGGSPIEPSVPEYKYQLKRVKELVDEGFPMDHVVLRIDPIFPTKKGLIRLRSVLDHAFELDLLPDMRCRISILDEYPHVKERFKRLGFEPIYGDSFQASCDQLQAVADTLARYNMKFYTCAEPELAKLGKPGQIETAGCLSNQDLHIMGLPEYHDGINKQNRHGCLCCGCKKELLERKKPCTHACAYCYWKD